MVNIVLIKALLLKWEPRLLLFLDLLKPPRMFGMRQPPTKIDPNQIPRPISSSSPIVYETRQGNSANPPPVKGCDFRESGPVQCSHCKGYINPFMKFIDQERKFICNLCVPLEFRTIA